MDEWLSDGSGPFTGVRALEAEPTFRGVRGHGAVTPLSCSLPGLVNNTGIDWFMPWPSQALHAVAKSFLGEWQLIRGPQKVVRYHFAAFEFRPTRFLHC